MSSLCLPSKLFKLVFELVVVGIKIEKAQFIQADFNLNGWYAYLMLKV